MTLDDLGTFKTCFVTPIGKWLGSNLYEFANDLLSDDGVRRRGIYNYKEVKTMLKEHREGNKEYTHQAWVMLVLEECIQK